MAFTYGTTGVKQKDYRVYIAQTVNGITTALATFVGTPNLVNFNALINAMGGAGACELGECRADSIDLGIDDGDSIDGNVLGKIVLNKAGKFSVELINTTVGNIAALEALDGIACTIILQERETHGVNLKTVIAMNNFVVSYTEKITGGDSIRATASIERNVASASAFRTIKDYTNA